MNFNRIKENVKENENGCWIWQRSCNSSGYGQLWENKKFWFAHRYALSCKTIVSSEDVVRHLCHNRKCVNPDHLAIGTHLDNYRDSLEVHAEKAAKLRKEWIVNGINHGTIKNASLKTGLSESSLVKYTCKETRIFDIEAYRIGCKKANVTPRV